MSENIFSVDIGGSKLICGVLDANGNVLDMHRAEYPKEYSLDTVIALITEGYEKLDTSNCKWCGVAIPGLANPQSGEWMYSPFSGIADVQIVKIISEITSLPTFCDNDVNISALAEKYFGICKQTEDFLWMTVSNGIGGGLFLNGKLYCGKNFTAGEIGHFIVEENSARLCGCGRCGCLEAMASGASISAIYREKTGKSYSAKQIAENARNGDETANRVWYDAGYYIGKASAMAVNLLGIDTVVLGGGAAEAFDLLKVSAEKALGDFLFIRANPNVKIMHSSLGSYAALKGCAALVLDNLKGDIIC